MAVETLSAMPAQFVAGDTLKVTFGDADAPASEGWALTFAMKGPEQFTVGGVADGDDFLVTIPSTTTKDKLAGLYEWSAYAEKAGERITIDRGQVLMTANVGSVTESYAKTCLDLLEAHITGRLPSGLQSHTINGNQISKMSMKDAIELRNYFRAEVAREQSASTGRSAGTVVRQRFA